MIRNTKFNSHTVLLFIIFFTIFSSVHASNASSSLDVNELLIEEWVLDSISEGSYNNFVQLWEDLGIIQSDYLLLETYPTDIKLLFYQHSLGEAIIYVEIHIYDSASYAEAEYNIQKSRSRPPIFERFLYGERIFQEGRYLIFVFSNEEAEQTLIPYNKYGQTYISLVDDFFIKLFQRLSPILYGYSENPPSVAYTGKVIWGIQPGDVFTWNSSYETFTGSLATGMSHSSGSSSTTLEVFEMSDDGYAVLIGELKTNFKIFNEYFSSIILDTEYYIYTWLTVDNGPLKPETSSGSQVTIFPLYLDGKTIGNFIEEEIDHLPEKNYIEGAFSISGHGRTSSGSGYTPLKTEWIDITIHTNTGIMTHYDFYYNDNEYSITTSRSMSLVGSNFDLNKRNVNIQILELDAVISKDTLERGEAVGVEVIVTDTFDNLVEGVNVKASVEGITLELTGMGNGRYEGSIATRDLSIGEHQIIIVAEKEDYESGTMTQQIIVQTPALYITTTIPSTTISKGSKITLTAEVVDASNSPVNGAIVSSTINNQNIVLEEKGDGEYQTRIDTKEYEEGPYTIVTLAEKTGYISGTTQISITVEKARGIPGFPYIAVLLGLIIGLIILENKK